MSDYQQSIAAIEFTSIPMPDNMIQEDGSPWAYAWVGPDGIEYETKQQAMFGSLQCGCGCGNSAEVHTFIIECVKQFKSRKDSDWKSSGVYGIKALMLANPDIAAEFIGHVLNGEHLLEHGGSVFGSWPTPRGEQFIAIGSMEHERDEGHAA